MAANFQRIFRNLSLALQSDSLTGGGGRQLFSSEYIALLALLHSLLVGSSGGGSGQGGAILQTLLNLLHLQLGLLNGVLNYKLTAINWVLKQQTWIIMRSAGSARSRRASKAPQARRIPVGWQLVSRQFKSKPAIFAHLKAGFALFLAMGAFIERCWIYKYISFFH
jgi:hypothetical protein